MIRIGVVQALVMPFVLGKLGLPLILAFGSYLPAILFAMPEGMAVQLYEIGSYRFLKMGRIGQHCTTMLKIHHSMNLGKMNFIQCFK